MARQRDGRIWARLTVDFPDNPKVAGLSDHAFRMLVEMICWAKGGLTDGFIPAGVMRHKWKTESVTDSDSEALTELLTNDATRPSLVPTDGGYMIHDFSEHQETKAEVEQRTARNRENGRRGGRPAKTESVTDSPTHKKADDRRQTFNPPTYVGGARPAPRDPDRIDAGTIVAEWIDSLPTRPPSRVIGQLSKEIKTMLDEGIPVEHVQAGVAEWQRKGLHPSTLASVVHEMSTPHSRGDSTSDRVREWMELDMGDQEQREIGA